MSGIYKNSKKILKRADEFSRAKFIGAFLGDLFKSLDDFNYQLSAVPIPNDLHSLLTDHADHILKFLREYPISSGKVSAKGVDLVENLKLKQGLFEETFKTFEGMPPEIAQIVIELNESILWFIEQHMRAVFSYIPGRPLPIKPSDWNGRELFEQEVKEHQIAYGPRKYPRYKRIQRIMEAQGIKLSERTYRNWKRLFESGELWNYFPSKK